MATQKIEIEAREDAATALAALSWYQRASLPGWAWYLTHFLTNWLPAAMFGALIAVMPGLVVGVRVPSAVAVGVLAAGTYFIAIRLLLAQVSGRARAWAQKGAPAGPAQMRFDAGGYRAYTAHGVARAVWSDVAGVEATPTALFIASPRAVHYVTAQSWPDAATMRADCERIVGWWQAEQGVEV